MTDPERPGEELRPARSPAGGEPSPPQPVGAGAADVDAGIPPPAAPARRRRRLRPIHGWLVLAAVLAALAVARWAGLGPTFLDGARVESDIAEQFEERYDVAVEVDCPRGMGVVEGREHECEAETEDGEEITVVLTITDEDPAAYEWDVE